MTIDLHVVPSSKSRNKKKVESSIPKWTVFSLCIITILVVVAIIKAILPLLFFGLLLAFIWSQATKPVAQFKKELKPSGQQLNLFYQNQIKSKPSKNSTEEKKESRAA